MSKASSFHVGLDVGKLHASDDSVFRNSLFEELVWSSDAA
jgi:hypothetical protein